MLTTANANTSIKMAFTDYRTLVNDIVNHGLDTGTTKMLSLRGFKLPMNHNRVVSMPAVRLNKKTSMKYMLAESMWYVNATRDPSLIEPFGKIWKKMEDENGNVNSNYGYQLLHQNDVHECITKLCHIDAEGHSECMMRLIGHDNIASCTDMPCNNVIHAELNVTDRCATISLTIIARSIDVIYGLPYDMAAAQSLGWLLCCSVSRHMSRTVSLKEVAFEIVNAHVYKSDLASVTDDDMRSFMDNDRIVVIPFACTPMSSNWREQYQPGSGLTVAKMRNDRDRLSQYATYCDDAERINESHTSHLEIDCFGDHAAVMNWFNTVYNHRISVSDVQRVTGRFNADEFDRKLAWFDTADDNSRLCYLTHLTDDRDGDICIVHVKLKP